MLRQLKAEFIGYLQQNIILYLIIIFVFLSGITSGAFTVGSMSSYQKENLGAFLGQFFNTVSNQPVDNGAILFESLWQHLQSVFLIWLCGLFFIGIPVTLIVMVVRGFLIGFTVGFLVGNYGLGGFLFSLICILPQTVVYVLCYITMGAFSLEYAIEGFKRRKIPYSRDEKLNRALPYTVKIFLLFLVLSVGSLFEAFIVPVFFRFFTWIFV